MRIGVDAACWSNRRGYGRFARELLRALLELDQRSEYVFFMDPETASQSDLPGRVVLKVPEISEAPTRAASAKGRRSLRDIWTMSRAVAKEKLDIFFFPSVYTYFPLFGGEKKVVAIHDVIAEQLPHLIFTSKKHRLFWNLKVRAAIWQSDLIITVSDHSKRGIMDHYKLAEKQIRVVTEAPDSFFCPLAKNAEYPEKLSRFGLGFPERFILYVGGIAPHKNLLVLVRAFSMLAEKSGYGDIKLVLAGDYQKDAFRIDHNLRNQIEELHLEHKVVFTGFVPDEDLVYLYNAASVLVLPSFNEGFGLPAIESMACGTPVIGSRTTSLPEVIGDAGLFFDPRNPHELLEKLLYILDNEAFREELSRRSLQRAATFSWRKSAATLSSIFEELKSGVPTT